MKILSREELLSLEAYAQCRDQFRRQVMTYKTDRKIHLGEHIRLLFEDRATIQYQIQEMLRAERIFEAEAIQEELDTYNPLIPDGTNWKATMMIEYTDTEKRREALSRLIGVEDRVWVQVDGYQRVYAVADEDLERENAEKTSSVHFLSFQLTPEMIDSLVQGSSLAMGVDHPQMQVVESIPEKNRLALMKDFADNPAAQLPLSQGN